MKVIIYSAYPPTPHLDTDLELAKLHMQQGDEVHLICCDGALPSCLYNPYHTKILCALCRHIYRRGLRCASVPPTRIHYLERVNDIQILPDMKPSNMEELKAVVFDKSDVGMAVASTLISLFSNHDFNIAVHSDIINRALLSACIVHTSVNAIMDKNKPGKVYIFNGRFFTNRPVLRICQNRNVRFVTHERAGIVAKYCIYDNVMCHDINYNKEEIKSIWANHPETKKEKIGAQFFINNRNRVVQSWEVFTKKQIKGCLPDNFKHSARNIVLYTTSIIEFAAVDGYDNPIYRDDIEGLDKILGFLSGIDCFVYVRAHPNLSNLDNAQNRITAEICGRYRNVIYISPEQKIDTYALMDVADTVLTFGSTMGVEACYWGKTSILLGRAIYEDLGCSYVPKSHDEVKHCLRAILPPKEKLGAIMYGYWVLARGQNFKYFEPDGLFSGKFMGCKIASPPLFLRIALKMMNLVKMFIR